MFRKNYNQGKTMLEVEVFTDPLCCWSWAMEPHLRRIKYVLHRNANWKYRMVGLLVDWNSYNDPFHSVSKPAQMGPVWKEAKNLSGMPIDDTIWVKNPPSSSYPACLAVKTAELQGNYVGEMYLRRVREAAMLQCRDVSRANVLLKVAGELSEEYPELFDYATFRDDFLEKKAIGDFQDDLSRAKLLSVNKCPTIIIRPQRGKGMVVSGYRPYAQLSEILRKVWPGSASGEEFDPERYQAFWKGNVLKEELKIIGISEEVIA